MDTTTNSPWIQFDLDYLKDNYEKLSLNEISKYLNRTECAISRKVCELKLNSYPVHNYDRDFFSKKNIVTSYIAGLFAADGCIVRSHGEIKGICIGLKQEESEFKLLNEIKSIIGYEGKIYKKDIIKSEKQLQNYPFKKRKYKQYILNISSKDLAHSLINNYNVVPRKTYNFIIPKLKIGSNNAMGFILGMFDGDGCLCWDSTYKRYIFSIASFLKSPLVWIKKNLTSRIPILSSAYSITEHKTKNGITHNLTFYNKKAIIVINELQNSTKNAPRLSRKIYTP